MGSKACERRKEQASMITVSGTHICEHCGQSYDWIARKIENGEAVFGRIEDIRSKNIKYSDDKMIVGKCPHCGNPSMKKLRES